MKGNPLKRKRREEILFIINDISDEKFLEFYNRSLKKKDFCELVGITYSTSNFHKINDRLNRLGIDDSLIKFKNKQKLAFKDDLEQRLKTIEDEQFEIIFNDSLSVSEICQKLGFNYKNSIITSLIRQRIQTMNLGIEKFKPREWDIESVKRILVNSPRFRGNLSSLLKRFSIIPNDVCQECGIKDWNEKELVLELHHIDGNNRNNMTHNLVFLCPNCHSITDNHRNKKRRSAE